MERAHYRRIMPSRLHYDTTDAAELSAPVTQSLSRTSSLKTSSRQQRNQQSESVGISETLIFQGAISVIIFVIVLGISLIDVAPTIALRGGLRQVLAGHVTLAEFVDGARSFGETWLGFGPSEDADFLPEPAERPLSFPVPETPVAYQGQAHNEAFQYMQPYMQFPPTTYDAILLPIVTPGLSETPGLWD